MRTGTAFCISLLCLAATAPGAGADMHIAAGKTASDTSLAPPKDCTRTNGRAGYYGNMWCTPREQLAWDLWEARRLARTTK